MSKQLLFKQLYIILNILILIFLFPRNTVYADFKQSTEEEMHTSNISKFMIGAFGDFLNRSLNAMGTNIPENETQYLVYTKDYLEKNLLLKSQINVIELESENDDSENTNEEENSQNIEPGTIVLSNEVCNKFGDSEEVFTKDTPIPVIPLDIYTISSGKSPLLDINFWTLSKKNVNEKWVFIKNIVISWAHVILYLAIGLIITMVIWRSILFVYYVTTQQAEKVANSKKIMDNLFNVILMVIGVYLLMISCTILHDKAIQFIFRNNTSNYPFKVVVQNVYSFNSNATGVLKYMSLSSNVMHQLGWSIAYCVFSIICFIYFFLMLFRMLILGVLSIMAPFTAVMKMSGLSDGKGLINILHFKNWVKFYLRFTFIPVVIAFAVHIITGV